MDMTDAGIDEAKVRPTFRPRYIFAAVKTIVMSAPRITPRNVNSTGEDEDIFVPFKRAPMGAIKTGNSDNLLARHSLKGSTV